MRRLKRKGARVSVLVFCLDVDLPLAQAAIRAGAQGFIRAGMQPEQIGRAVEVAAREAEGRRRSQTWVPVRHRLPACN